MLAVVAGFWIRDLALPVLVAIAPALAILGCGVGFRRLLQKLGAATDDEQSLSSRAAEYLIGYPVFGTICFLVGHLSTKSATQGALTLLVGEAFWGQWRAWLPRSLGAWLEACQARLIGES